MVEEYKLFDDSELFLVDREIIDEVSIPKGDRYEDGIFERYFGSYAGIAKKYKPKRIYEIGVRYGYTAICMLTGAHSNPGSPKPVYRGVDDESYHYGSCDVANQNFAKAVPWADASCRRWNAFNGLPPDIGTFDLISIDGNHDFGGVLNDLNYCYPVLNPNGIILLDDYSFPQVQAAIHHWLEGMKNSKDLLRYQVQDNHVQHFIIQRCLPT